jgi:hypothetical protein
MTQEKPLIKNNKRQFQTYFLMKTNKQSILLILTILKRNMTSRHLNFKTFH